MAPQFFLYARKSTDAEDRQVLSIEAQLAEIRLYAERERLLIKREFVESMTAKQPGRPIFNDMIARLERGEADGIVTWHPDRLARNSIDGGRVVYLLDIGHIKFLKCPTFWFENTPQGKFMLNIAFGQSKYFIDNLSENVKRGIRQKLRRGEWPSFSPIGYVADPKSRQLIVDPVKGPGVRKLFEAHASGKHTLKDLQQLSAPWGLVSRKGRPLPVSLVQHILNNTFYYGLMRFKGELYPGIHEPLISKDLFERVQEMLVRKGRPHKYRKHDFPLLGLAQCATCGCSVTAERQKGHHYYRCTKKRGECPEPYVREEVLADQIRAGIDRVALPSDMFQKLLAAWAQERTEVNQPIARLKTELAERLPALQGKLDRLLDARLDGLIEKSEYQSKKEALLKEKIVLEEKLRQWERGAIGWLEPCREFLEAAHGARQRAASENLASRRDFLPLWDTVRTHFQQLL